MPWFIKREIFTKEAEKMSSTKKQIVIDQHKEWVFNLQNSGYKVLSGYLVDAKKNPGGGGLLLLEDTSFKSALSIVERDPIILAGVVEWDLHEWITISGKIDF